MGLLDGMLVFLSVVLYSRFELTQPEQRDLMTYIFFHIIIIL